MNSSNLISPRLRRSRVGPCTLLMAAALFGSGPVAAQPVIYNEISSDTSYGLTYSRTPPPRYQTLRGMVDRGAISLEEFVNAPYQPLGISGAAMLDFDNDGDLDLYVTNGPGTYNSMFVNQLRETGEFRFVDHGEMSGAGLPDHDSAAVCFADTDNDNDTDMFVLGTGEPNRFLENNGDGTFTDRTTHSGLAGGNFNSTGCSFGDINNDGLVDVVVGNMHDITNTLSLFVVPFLFAEQNELYLNTGGNAFEDISDSSGIRQHAVIPADAAGLTLSVAMVDFDQDGDVDIFAADDQGNLPAADRGGVDIGVVHVFENDGHGNFTDVTAQVNMAVPGAYMGLSFADYNCDDHIDVFASNFGDFANFSGAFGNPGELGREASEWYLGGPDGVFSRPGVGDLIATPFGWGTVSVDFDNDGDSDIIFHGGMLGMAFELSNAGVVLENVDCSAEFIYRPDALAASVDHGRRGVRGVAAGDLNQDGFLDLVTTAEFVIPPEVPTLPFPVDFGSPFESQARFLPALLPAETPGFLVPNFITPDHGDLAVEISSGNGNGFASIRPSGMVGILDDARVNRDGLGAVVRFRSDGEEGISAIQTITSGATHLSQSPLDAHFGLGTAASGTVDILWPGGVRNRLYGVREGERLIVPEIPCDFGDAGQTSREYYFCVFTAVSGLLQAEVVEIDLGIRLLTSALRAFVEQRRG